MFRLRFTTAQVIKQYPGLTLAVLVGHPSLAYDHGKYRESFGEELGLDCDLRSGGYTVHNVDGIDADQLTALMPMA